jgi:hypothetical protein
LVGPAPIGALSGGHIMEEKKQPNKYRRATVEELVMMAFEAKKEESNFRMKRCEWYMFDKNNMRRPDYEGR